MFIAVTLLFSRIEFASCMRRVSSLVNGTDKKQTQARQSQARWQCLFRFIFQPYPTICLIRLIREYETQLPRTIVPRYSNVHLRMRLACSRAGTPACRHHRLLTPRSLRRNPHLRRLPHRYRLPLPLPQITDEKVLYVYCCFAVPS